MRRSSVRFPEDIFPDIKLHRDSFVPFYQQIANQIRHFIKTSQDDIVGSSFWSEGEVAERLEISKMTVRQAFQTLRKEGLLVIEKGRRPVIGSGHAGKDFQQLRGFTEEMSQRGLRPSSKLLALEAQKPDSDTANALRLKRTQDVFCIKRLRFVDNELAGLETTYIPYHFFHGLDKQDLEKNSLYSIIEGQYGISLSWSEEEIRAIAATEKEASLLKIPPGFPLFYMRRTVYDTRSTPIEHGVSLFRGDRYSAIVVSRRKSATPGIVGS